MPDELSGGQRQRVTIARALVNDPAIVWADEPTGDLDSENAEDVLRLMRRLNLERGLTFLIVTHDIGIGRGCDRIVRMVDGLITEDHRLEVPVYSRITLLEFDPLRFDVAETLDASGVVLPGCRTARLRGRARARERGGEGPRPDDVGIAEDADAALASGFWTRRWSSS